MKFESHIIDNTIDKLILGRDYREQIINMVSATFFNYVIYFFKKIVLLKLKDKELNLDWYKKFMLSQDHFSTDDIAINAGINKKTISNIYRSSTQKIVLEASMSNYEELSNIINKLIDSNNEIDFQLTIKIKSVSIDLNLNETLIVINSLAIKRAALTGGAWSSIGKNVEKKLMIKLCDIFKVPKKNIKEKFVKQKKLKDLDFDREVDFYLIDKNDKEYLCEVKLMGKGNPESADVVFARKTDILIADTLSNQNKNQLEKNGIEWLMLRGNNDVLNDFSKILKKFDIPHENI